VASRRLTAYWRAKTWATVFAELLLAGRPDLTMEALVLRPEFSPLFTPKELTTAAERLRMRER